MQGSLSIGRIGGIEIAVHYTWLIIFALVTWSLAVGFFPVNYPAWAPITYWITAAVAALALFASVLIHELSHSFMALSRGIGVSSIALFVFGGVSNLKTESEAPQDEFLISVVGPLTSFVLAAVIWTASQVLQPGDSPLGAVLSYLTLINGLLGAFNLLPGFPLDGGRVLRSIVWGMTGNLRTATQVASIAGQLIGFLLIFWGVSLIFSGVFFNGLWAVFIGWFLNSAAEATRQQQVLQEHLRGVSVAMVMNAEPPVVPPDLTVQDFVFDHVLGSRERAALIVDESKLVGIASLSDVKKVPQEVWPRTRISEIMTPAPLHTVAPQTPLDQVLALLVGGELNQLPVLEEGRLVGMLTRAHLLRFLQVSQELNLVSRRRRSGAIRPGQPPAAA